MCVCVVIKSNASPHASGSARTCVASCEAVECTKFVVLDLQERQWHFALTTLESMTVCESLQPNLITCSATAEAPVGIATVCPMDRPSLECKRMHVLHACAWVSKVTKRTATIHAYHIRNSPRNRLASVVGVSRIPSTDHGQTSQDEEKGLGVWMSVDSLQGTVCLVSASLQFTSLKLRATKIPFTLDTGPSAKIAGQSHKQFASKMPSG